MIGVQTDCKVYVNVRAAFLPDGKMLPEELTLGRRNTLYN